MFSTLLGSLPPDPDRARASADERVLGAVSDLETAGLELLTDGEALDLAAPPAPEAVVEAWRRAAGATSRAVKAVLPGPYSASRTGAAPRRSGAAKWAEALQPAITALSAAGCPFVEIDEPDALAITVVAAERARFVDAHRRLTDGIEGIHLSLALTGGNLEEAGAATFFDLQYASYAFDLIAGPDNWRLIAVAPGDRGIVCGALSAQTRYDSGRELLVWAAHYAASTRGRGIERVGLANASSLAALPRAEAIARLAIIADAARIAAVASPEELSRLLDPRATSRAAARRQGA